MEQDHSCRWTQNYAYASQQRDIKERQLRACDAGMKKLVQTICPYFQPGKPFEFPGPNGTCGAADNEVCQIKCKKEIWQIEDGRLVKV